MASRSRDISRRGAIVVLIGSVVGAGTARVAGQKKPPPKKKTIDPKVPGEGAQHHRGAARSRR